VAKNLTLNLKRRLEAGEKIFGTLVGWGNEPGPTLKALQEFGYDFVMLDLEHSLVSKDAVLDYLRVADELDVPLMMRPEENNANFRCYLDAGISGLVLPHVDTVEEAVFAVNQAYFPPIGHRGCGISASPYLVDKQSLTAVPFLKLLKEINNSIFNSILLFPQTESLRNISSLRQILALEGVTGTMVGTYDLALDMGDIDLKALMPQVIETEAVADKLKQVARICRETGKVAGMGGFGPQGYAKWSREGYQVFMLGYVANGNVNQMRNLVKETKSLMK